MNTTTTTTTTTTTGLCAAEPGVFHLLANFLTRQQIHTLSDALTQYTENQVDWDGEDEDSQYWEDGADERARAECAEVMLDIINAKMAEAAEG